MCKKDNVSIRKFAFEDITKKIEWINDERNNKFLHYDIPLVYANTVKWYERIKDSELRYDAVIEYDGEAVGLTGLLNIDKGNKKAEFYICLGENQYKGKGIARKASEILIQYAFENLGLNRVYLYTEEENTVAQKLFEKLGFEKEGLLKSDLVFKGRIVNRYIYGLVKEV